MRTRYQILIDGKPVKAPGGSLRVGVPIKVPCKENKEKTGIIERGKNGKFRIRTPLTVREINKIQRRHGGSPDYLTVADVEALERKFLKAIILSGDRELVGYLQNKYGEDFFKHVD